MTYKNRSAPHQTTVSEIVDLATVPVWSASKPNAAGLLGVSRFTAYNLARSGQMITIRLGRGRLVVPVAPLLRMLGCFTPDAPGKS